MGRRGTDAGTGVDDTVEPKVKAWESIRRTLGRLIAHPQVREITEGQRELPVRLRATEALGTLTALTGVGEGGWKLLPSLRAVPIPHAQAGGQDRDLLPGARVTLENQAMLSPVCHSLPPVGVADCRVENADVVSVVETVRLPSAFLSLPSSPVLVQSCPLLPVPPMRACPVPCFRAPKVGVTRIPKPAAPRVRWGDDAVLSRMALTRWGRETPVGVFADAAFAPERWRLAEATGLPLLDVTLLGVYEQVPILAVSRIVVEDEGRRLRLWLKPDALRDKRASRRITLLVGRRISDGKMLQAAL